MLGGAQAMPALHPSTLYPYAGRRPREASDKGNVCAAAGCGKAFYRRSELNRHQRLKHAAADEDSRDPAGGAVGGETPLRRL